MRRILCTAVFALLAGLTGASHGSALDALKNFARTTTTAAGAFTQHAVDKNGPVAGADASGRFVFERPGKFLWETVKPYPQTIVSDARAVYIWDPDLNQVTVRKITAAMGATPAAILFGRGDIEKSFALTPLQDQEGLQWVSAVPRTEDFTYKRFEIGFDDSGMLAAMRLFDHFGQVVTLRFTDVAVNKPVEPQVFEFKIPQGADVLEDTH